MEPERRKNVRRTRERIKSVDSIRRDFCPLAPAL